MHNTIVFASNLMQYHALYALGTSTSLLSSVVERAVKLTRRACSHLSALSLNSLGLALAEAHKVAASAKTEVDRIAGEAEKQAKAVQQDVKKSAAASQSAGSKKPAKK